MNHLVISPILLPAVMAGLTILIARRNLFLVRVLAAGTVMGLFALALYGLGQSQPIPYFLGSWPAPFGIVLVMDRLASLMLLLVASLSIVVLLYAYSSGWDQRGRHFYALFQFQLMGLNGAFLTADAFNLFVFFEVLLIASYGLMVHGGGAARTRAGVQYVAFNLVGSTLFLFALAVIYNVTGTLNMADISEKLPLLPQGDAGLVRAAAVMLMMVFAVKGALVPLQFWLPGTYSVTSGPVAALFAVMTKVGAYAIIRFGTLVFPPSLTVTGALWGDLLWVAAIVTIMVGALGVLAAQRLQLTVSFAAIGSMGVVFLAVSDFTPASTAAALYYIIHSTLATALLFLLADLVLTQRKTDDLAQPAPVFAGVGTIGAAFMLGAIAMVGLPPLSGFVAKLMVLDSLRDNAVWGWTAVLLGSLVTMIGFARAGSMVFWNADFAAPRLTRKINLVLWLPIGALIAMIVGMTIFAGPISDWIKLLVQDLYDPSAYIMVQRLVTEY